MTDLDDTSERQSYNEDFLLSGLRADATLLQALLDCLIGHFLNTDASPILLEICKVKWWPRYTE